VSTRSKILAGLAFTLAVGACAEFQPGYERRKRNGFIVYVRDDRTGLCFARWRNGGGVVVECSPQVIAQAEEDAR
jgi:hypothetical protein